VWGLGCGREVEGLELGARPLVGGAGVVDDHAGLDLFWVARHGGGAGETPPSLGSSALLCFPLWCRLVLSKLWDWQRLRLLLPLRAYKTGRNPPWRERRAYLAWIILPSPSQDTLLVRK
jgi:hypothetical protein